MQRRLWVAVAYTRNGSPFVEWPLMRRVGILRGEALLLGSHGGRSRTYGGASEGMLKFVSSNGVFTLRLKDAPDDARPSRIQKKYKWGGSLLVAVGEIPDEVHIHGDVVAQTLGNINASGRTTAQ